MSNLVPDSVKGTGFYTPMDIAPGEFTSAPTPNNQDELFELCREVYKRTGWKAPIVRSIEGTDGLPEAAPIYNSDYLLEKLPVYSDDAEGMLSITTRQGVERNGWLAYYEDMDGYSVLHEGIAKSPLKALLKLVIALDDAGVKL